MRLQQRDHFGNRIIVRLLGLQWQNDLKCRMPADDDQDIRVRTLEIFKYVLHMGEMIYGIWLGYTGAWGAP